MVGVSAALSRGLAFALGGFLVGSCSVHDQAGALDSWGAFASSPPSHAQTASAAPKPEPVENERTRQAHLVVQQRMHGVVLADTPLVHFVPIEDPSGTALQGFHGALRKLERGEDDDGKVRIAVYGSSSVSADFYTGYLRGYLQHRFGDGGVGFIPLAPLSRWYRHNEVHTRSSRNWLIEHAQKHDGRQDGHYGLLGASIMTARKRTMTKIQASTSAHTDLKQARRLELYYLEQPQGGRFRLSTGSRKHPLVSTDGEVFAPGYVSIEDTRSVLPLELEAMGDGEVRLFGATVERAEDGVVVDTLGIGGTRAANHLAWNEALWIDNMSRRSPDLYVLAYGANEAVDEDEPIALYRANLESVLDRFSTVLPHASCVLIGPVDFPQQDEQGAWQSRPRIDAIIDTQREVARHKGCGFWDTRAFMGGRGAMDAWVTAQPPLAKSDHLHLSTLGYLYLGKTFTDALMAEFDAAS